MSEITIISLMKSPKRIKISWGKISATYTNGQVKVIQAINVQLLETYRQIGQHVVEFE
jgi:GR25 family glycosyltransferase involved in LPS biosynthesis